MLYTLAHRHNDKYDAAKKKKKVQSEQNLKR